MVVLLRVVEGVGCLQVLAVGLLRLGVLQVDADGGDLWWWEVNWEG